VSYDADPRTDPGVPANPAVVIVRGHEFVSGTEQKRRTDDDTPGNY